ncbi:FtsX-like permease family protein [Saccharopolyspora sp. MS10]|uniref:FtsX-like permease family protein n=1 Tax=Saccharopolyspora sp. MS10 TaxID=3385973 RepID=UPI0039A0395B
MSRLRAWFADLALGVRLAVGDRHTPWGRLALMTAGIGIGVAVLLASAAMPTMMDARDERSTARHMGWADAEDANLPALVLAVDGSTSFHGDVIHGKLVQPQRPDAPLPGGLGRYPAPGELVVSPALAELLAEPGSGLLRERLHGPVTGLIGQDGLLAPGELYFYQGATGLTGSNATHRVDHHYGEDADDGGSGLRELWLLWAVGVCVLLLPVAVFVISTTRLAEAARQRRLAALRLVGGGAWQVRRIASGEALVGALTGVVAGWALFLGLRAGAEGFGSGQGSVFTSDLNPVWWMAVLITLGVPVLTVFISLVVLRGAVRDPLRSVRRGSPVRRRLWPRCVPLVLGACGIAAGAWAARLQGSAFAYQLIVSVSLMLLSVPLLLPWLLDELARRTRGGPVAWQLALRRLHITSGTAARSVSAIAVVVTGVIALQTIITSMERSVFAPEHGASRTGELVASGQEHVPGRDGLVAALDGIRELPGVGEVLGGHSVSVELGSSSRSVDIVDCATLARHTRVEGCVDGAAYRTPRGRGEPDASGGTEPAPPLREGDVVELSTRGSDSAGAVAWPLPPLRDIGEVDGRSGQLQYADVVLTPAAAAAIPVEVRSAWIEVETLGEPSQDLVEAVRNQVAANLASSTVNDYGASRAQLREQAEQIRTAKYVLLLGAVVPFGLIGCSLLVTAIEQIQERRRPMAVLGAVGARRSTLVWSAFLQNAVPMLLTVLLAVPIGVGTGALIMVVYFQEFPGLDLPGMGAVLGFAAVSVLVVTALTAPALSRAMSSEGLHFE